MIDFEEDAHNTGFINALQADILEVCDGEDNSGRRKPTLAILQEKLGNLIKRILARYSLGKSKAVLDVVGHVIHSVETLYKFVGCKYLYQYHALLYGKMSKKYC